MSETPKLRAVLVIFTSQKARTALNTILVRTGFTVHHASTLDEAVIVISQSGAGVVLCENQLAEGHSWRDVLARLQDQPHPPPLIVAHRLADEALWAEVLNLGAYDLLIEPFDSVEVTRVLELAWSSWANKGGRAHGPQPSGSEQTTPVHGASDLST